MAFYVNDTKNQATLLICRSFKEASIYATWANENLDCNYIRADTERCAHLITGEKLLSYYGFTIDSLIERLFSLLPSRSRVDSNVALIKILLKNTDISKSASCQQANKYPTHYSRLSNTLGQHSTWIASVTGGRNPMKLLRGIRGDL